MIGWSVRLGRCGVEAREQLGRRGLRAKCAVGVENDVGINRKVGRAVAGEPFLACRVEVIAGGRKEDEFLAETVG